MLKAIHGLRSVVVIASYANERLMNKLLASSTLFACRREESLASSASELHERFPKRKTFRHLIIIPHILGILQFALDSVDGKFMWLSDCRENDRGREASSDDSVGNGIEKYLNNSDDQAFSGDCLLSFWFFYDNLPRWQINRKRRLVNKRAETDSRRLGLHTDERPNRKHEKAICIPRVNRLLTFCQSRLSTPSPWWCDELIDIPI